MNEFLESHNFGRLLPIFEGLSDEEFFSLSHIDICQKLAQTEMFVDFIIPYDRVQKHKKSIDSMEVDLVHETEQTENENTSDSLHHSSSIHSPPSQPSNVRQSVSDLHVQFANLNNASVNSLTSEDNHADHFEYVKNDLYEFLISEPEGEIILGKYQHEKIFDEARLKNLVLVHRIFDDRRKWKISSATFLELRDQIVELFPNQDLSRIYIPPIEGEQAQGPRGYLYNYYRVLRKELRQAGMLKVHDTDENNENDSSILNKSDASESGNTNSLCLTDTNRDLYTTVQVAQKWQDIYDQRMASLNKIEKRKKVIKLKQYFESFPCLEPPLGKLLLEQDFDCYIRSLVKKNLILDDEETIGSYASRFSRVWPELSKKIIVKFKTLKTPELQTFFSEHQQLFEDGTHDNTLALMLISFGFRLSRKIKIDNVFKTLTRNEISRCFILHVPNAAERDKEQEKLEIWLTTLGQEVVPNVVCCGKLESHSAFVCINKHFLYPCADLVKAVECCFKCLIVLNSTPFISEFAWTLIYKAIYGFNFKTVPSNVTKFIQDLRDMKS